MAELKPITVTTVELTAKQYAAIHLCVPDSGDADLDAMIRRAQRERLAGQMYAGMIAADNLQSWEGNNVGGVSHVAYVLADAVIAAGEVKHG
jgi:hypothetical protein